jgi:glycerophosphoryl diester phosphodiesterase
MGYRLHPTHEWCRYQGDILLADTHETAKKMICFAHRGASGHAPENTLLAIQKAIDMDAPWIEIDVFCVDNELVVIHNERLEHTTNGTGYVWDQTLEQLRSLDAGKGQQIPLLQEVFDLVNCRAGINVELKAPGTAAPVVSMIGNYVTCHNWRYDQVLVSSFNHHELVAAKTLNPKIKIAPVIAGLPLHYARFAQEMGAYSVHISLGFVNRKFVEDAHNRGLSVFVYTVNHADDIKRMAKIGVDGVFTNFPELIC